MNFIKGASLTLAVQIIATLGGIFSSVILARALGPEGRGILALLTLIPATVVAFTGFNLGGANVYYLNKNELSLKEVIRVNYMSLAIIGIPSFIISVIMFKIWPDAIVRDLELKYIIIASLTIFFGLFSGYFNSIVLAFQKMLRYNIVSLITPFANILLLLILLYKLQLGVWGALLAMLFVGPLGCLIVWANVWSISRKKTLSQKHLYNNKEHIIGTIKKLVWFGARNSLNNILWYLILRSDMFLVSGFLGIEALGYYTIAVSMSEKLKLIPMAMGTVLFPKASSMNSMDKVKFIGRITKYTFWIVLLLSIPLILAGRMVIKILFSEDFLPATNALRIVLLATAFLAIANVLGYEFTTSGKPGTNAYFYGTGLVLNLFLNYFLIPRYNIEGAAMASLTAYSVISVLCIMRVSKTRNINFLEFLLPQKVDWVYARRLIRDFAGGVKAWKL